MRKTWKKIASPNQTKVCPQCGEELSLDNYSKGTGMYGRRSMCKKCDRIIHNTPEYRERRRLQRAQNRRNNVGYLDREKQVDLLRMKTNIDAYRKCLIRGAKQRAKRDNLSFNITYEDITIPEYCPLLGIKLNNHLGEGNNLVEDSPSIDKIIPSLGYIKGNVWVISNKANRIKSNATFEELELLVNNLKLNTNP